MMRFRNVFNPGEKTLIIQKLSCRVKAKLIPNKNDNTVEIIRRYIFCFFVKKAIQATLKELTEIKTIDTTYNALGIKSISVSIWAKVLVRDVPNMKISIVLKYNLGSFRPFLLHNQ